MKMLCDLLSILHIMLMVQRYSIKYVVLNMSLIACPILNLNLQSVHHGMQSWRTTLERRFGLPYVFL